MFNTSHRKVIKSAFSPQSLTFAQASVSFQAPSFPLCSFVGLCSFILMFSLPPKLCHLSLCPSLYGSLLFCCLSDCTQQVEIGSNMDFTILTKKYLLFAAAAAAKLLQSCPTLCDPIDGSPPGSPIPGILQERTLECVAIAFSNAGKWKVKVKSLSCVRLLVTPWTAAHQAPPSMGFCLGLCNSGKRCMLW